MRRAGWSGCLCAALLVLGACGGTAPELSGDRIAIRQPPAALPDADYRTQADSFAELQRAGLAADYEAFARGLRARDPAAVVAQLTEAFGGEPFDAYTLAARTGNRDHRRAVELRGPSDRLYLYLELDRSQGGWNVDEYELGRSRDAVARRL